MTKGFSIPLFFISIFFLSLTISSCNNDEPAGKPGFLSFHMHTLVDSVEFESYGDLLTRIDGRKITVNTAQLYISNIKLIKTDGGTVDGPSSVILVQPGIEEYELGEVPVGDYKTIRFDVGLSDEINASTPASSDPALFQPSMWFGATAQPDGFVFVNFQGTIDTTHSLAGTNLVPFVYKIGTNAHRVTVTMPDQLFNVVSDQLTVVHLEANYAKLLDGIELHQNANLSIKTAEENAWSWITQFMESNIEGMFDYEE